MGMIDSFLVGATNGQVASLWANYYKQDVLVKQPPSGSLGEEKSRVMHQPDAYTGTATTMTPEEQFRRAASSYNRNTNTGGAKH